MTKSESKTIILLTFDERSVAMQRVVVDEARRIIDADLPSSITNEASARDQRAIEEAIREKRIVARIAPERARTVYANIQIPPRGEETTQIDEAELERMVTTSIWKLFEVERGRVAAALEISEGETMIVDAHIWDIAINGKIVMNPLTLQSGEATIMLSATLMRESTWQAIQRGFGDAFAAVVESGASLAASIGKQYVGDALLVVVDEQRTKLYCKEGQRLGYHDGFQWGFKRLQSEIQKACGVGEAIAAHVLRTYAEGRGSGGARTKIEAAIRGEIRLLMHGIEHALGHRKKERAVALIVPWKLPGIPEYIHQFSSSEASADAGVRIEYEVGDMMPVIEAYMIPQQQLSNSIAKRYLRWRIPDNSLS